MNKEKLGQDPAFAKTAFAQEGVIDPPQEGMSKRFYAACAVLQGLVTGIPSDNASIWREEIVERSYKIADELLEQENA